MTNVAVDTIELRNQSSSLLTMSNAADLMELQYTINLVRDDLQGQEFTCIAVSGDTKYDETVVIEVQGILNYFHVMAHPYHSIQKCSQGDSCCPVSRYNMLFP